MSAIPYFNNFTETFFNREAGLRSRYMSRHVFGPDHYVYEREFHRHLLPALSIQDVHCPDGCIRHFTPDGKMLVVFCSDRHHILVLNYRGLGAAQEMLIDFDKDYLPANDYTGRNLHIRRQIFKRLFVKRHQICVVSKGHWNGNLNHDFCLFVDEGRIVLLASVAPATFAEDMNFNFFEYADILDDTRTDEYYFYLVDLVTGTVTDTLYYMEENIFLPHHQGVGFHDNILAICLIYRQAIDLIRITKEAKFERITTVAAFGSPEDRNLYLKTHEIVQPAYSISSLHLSHMKQKILTYNYRELQSIVCPEQRSKEISFYYWSFPYYETMLLDKIQMIDKSHILVRYGPRSIQSSGDLQIRSAAPRSSSQRRTNQKKINTNILRLLPIYVLYDFTKQKIVKIFKRESIELYNIMRHHSDALRDVYNHYTRYPSSSPSNNIIYRLALDRSMMQHSNQDEVRSHFNRVLPFSPQSFCCSPYLDYNLFSYDDRLFTSLNRPKPNLVDNIPIYDRKCGMPQYRLLLTKQLYDRVMLPPQYKKAPPTDQVTFICHPLDPLILSLQKLSSRFVLNIHIYNHYTKSRPEY